jgi:hypothetical protein
LQGSPSQLVTQHIQRRRNQCLRSAEIEGHRKGNGHSSEKLVLWTWERRLARKMLTQPGRSWQLNAPEGTRRATHPSLDKSAVQKILRGLSVQGRKSAFRAGEEPIAWGHSRSHVQPLGDRCGGLGSRTIDEAWCSCA